MAAGGAPLTVGPHCPRSKEPAVKKTLAITLAAAALILVLAFAALTVLTAVAGQKSGLEKSHHGAVSAHRLASGA